MSVQPLVRLALAGFAAFLLSALPSAPARAQSASAVATSNEILDLRGSMKIFEAIVPGVIEQSKNTLLQVNPNLFKDLTVVSEDLRKELTPRMAQLRTELARIYASRFTEQELKETLTFYKSPLGKKLLNEEAIFVDRSMSTAQDWAIKLNEEVLARFRAEMKKKGHAL